MWVPLVMGPELNVIGTWVFENRRARMLQVIGRLRPGTAVEQAHLEAAAYARQLARTYPATNETISVAVVPESRAHAGAQSLLRAPLRILMAMVLVVLLIACANVANLLLARSTARQRELSIRLAIGAGRGQVVRQLLTETLLLAASGALIGIPLAAWMQGGLAYLAPTSIGLPVGLELTTNGKVLAFAILVCAGATLAAGLWPALHAVCTEPNEALKEGGRSGTPGPRTLRMRDILVVVEVALAFVALTGAGLFVRSSGRP
jgi:ABC-type lipoprotein release transport system permease subunit